MNRPRGQHYLPARAYLAFFEVPEKPGFIHQYERGRDPVLVNIEKAGRKRDIYTLVGPGGEQDVTVETAFAGLESEARPILEKLNNSGANFRMALSERDTLLYYFAVLAIRTPAFRSQIGELVEALVELPLRVLAETPGALEASLEQGKRENPGKFDSLTAEIVEQVLLGDRYKVKVKPQFLLGQTLQSIEVVDSCLVTKKLSVLRVEGQYLVTSDHPVVPLPNPGAPPLIGSGFLMGHVFVPIGSHAAVMLHDLEEPPPEGVQTVPVHIRKVSPAQARAFNKLSMAHAERFLFACQANQAIKKLFDETSKPKRVRVSSVE